jgi:hypothetical protein
VAVLTKRWYQTLRNEEEAFQELDSDGTAAGAFAEYLNLIELSVREFCTDVVDFYVAYP